MSAMRGLIEGYNKEGEGFNNLLITYFIIMIFISLINV